MRVVLLCHFWNNRISELIHSDNKNELAPWIQETINLFENKNDIEMHVVAPNFGTNKNLCLTLNNIHYHFYKHSFYYLPAIIKRIFKYFFLVKIGDGIYTKMNLITSYYIPRKNINKIITRINPNLIHLYGSENLIYSVGILDFLEKIPILLTIQGYAYLLPEAASFLLKKHHSYRTKIEKKINTNVKYVTTSIKSEYFLPFKKNQVFFDYYGITRIPSILANKSFKKFDIVYYARICEEKGIEDLILAIERLHKNGYTLNVLIIGQSEEKYLNYLKQIILDKNLCKFFTFTGFIDDHQEVFKLASTAKMLVLPSHYDELNNTIREAMFMKLPVVAYNVGGIKEANIYRECITLVEKGNIDDLSEKILLVLNNYDRTLKLINNAYSEMNERYSPHRLYDLTISIYKSILNSI